MTMIMLLLCLRVNTHSIRVVIQRSISFFLFLKEKVENIFYNQVVKFHV